MHKHRFYKFKDNEYIPINIDDIDEDDIYKNILYISRSNKIRCLKLIGELETYSVNPFYYCCKDTNMYLFSKNTLQYYFKKNKTYYLKTLYDYNFLNMKFYPNVLLEELVKYFFNPIRIEKKLNLYGVDYLDCL